MDPFTSTALNSVATVATVDPTVLQDRARAASVLDLGYSALDTYDELFQKSIRERYKQIPAGRYGTESEVAAAIVFLLSPAAGFISGVALRMDGAVPHAKRIWPHTGNGGKTVPFDGFHLAAFPKVLQGLADN